MIETNGDFDDYLAVILRRGKLLLQANSAIYSWEDNYYNFRAAFEQLNWSLIPGNKALVLGLGLGSVIQMIEELFDKTLSYTAVEYDNTIVQLAEEYLLHRIQSPVQTIVADAEVFMDQNDEQFDLILVDLFVDSGIPNQFNSEYFLRNLKKALKPGGCLITNRLAYTEKDTLESKQYFIEPFTVVFPKGVVLDVDTNMMLFSDEVFLNE